MMALEGGSFGFQLGAQATDFLLLVMNDRGASSILSSKVKLGADASAAAGPKGRDAEAATDVTIRAEVLTYSRSRGLFGRQFAGRLDLEARQRCQRADLWPEDRGQGDCPAWSRSDSLIREGPYRYAEPTQPERDKVTSCVDLNSQP